MEPAGDAQRIDSLLLVQSQRPRHAQRVTDLDGRPAIGRFGWKAERPAIRDVRSMHGLVLEGLGFLIVAVFARPAALAEPWQCGVSPLSVVIVAGLWLRQRRLLKPED